MCSISKHTVSIDSPKTHYDVSSFDKLFAGLEDDGVCEVNEVSKQIQGKPIRDGALRVVRETEAHCDEPGVVVEGQSDQAEPGDVAPVSERVHGYPQNRVHQVLNRLQHHVHRKPGRFQQLGLRALLLLLLIYTLCFLFLLLLFLLLLILFLFLLLVLLLLLVSLLLLYPLLLRLPFPLLCDFCVDVFR